MMKQDLHGWLCGRVRADRDKLQAALDAAQDQARLEDVYLPYRPKRRTRAMLARERGLEPLAKALMLQQGRDPRLLAKPFVDAAKDVVDLDAALAGARDIIAERASEDEKAGGDGQAGSRRPVAEYPVLV